MTPWHFLLSWRSTSSTSLFCTRRSSSSVAPLPGVGLGAVDIQETPNAYLFKVDVPGLSKDDVKGAHSRRLLCWVGPCILHSARSCSCTLHYNDIASAFFPWEMHCM